MTGSGVRGPWSEEPTVKGWSDVPSTGYQPGGSGQDGAGLGGARRPKRRRSYKSTFIETLVIVGAAFAIAMLVQTFLIRNTGILQTSMQPTLEPGDQVVVDCITYEFREPRQGEIIVINDPTNEKKDIVKRLIAKGGDTIEVADGVVYVNGTVIDEPYVVYEDVATMQPKTTVPVGYVYVMGDNRPVSKDSRAFGPVAEDQIVGKVVCVIWPVGHWSRF